MPLDDILPQLHRLRATLERLDEHLKAASEWADLGAGVEFGALIGEVDDQIETAEREFTVALVGEFKVGKSTLLNGLLGLTGDAALSAHDTPDTACSIVLRYRQAGFTEARLVGRDGRTEDCTWVRAKGLTSRVYLDEHPLERARAADLREVQYFVDAPLLTQLQLNDLPGIGSRYWREDTALAHRKMTQADAILWVVAEREPSADARKALGILARYAHKVIPVVNVIEDPGSDPPLPRDRARDQELIDTLLREYHDFFSPEIKVPLLVSARVIETERSKPRPSPEVLRDAGLDDLLAVLERLVTEQGDAPQRGRRYRLAGAASAVITGARANVGTILGEIAEREPAFEARQGEAERRVADIAAVEESLRSTIRTLAEAQATDMCERIAHQAALFIEEEMQLTKVLNLRRALTARGRQRLSTELQERFLNQLGLRKTPSWLDHANDDFAERVRDLALAAWAALGRAESTSARRGRGASIPFGDLQRLGDGLRNAVVSVLARMIGVAGFTGVLALLPGAQLFVVIGFLGASSLASLGNPLAERRRRAVETVMGQIRFQKYAMANDLREAGQDASRDLGEAVRRRLEEALGEASKKYRQLLLLRSQLRDGHEALAALARGFGDAVREGWSG